MRRRAWLALILLVPAPSAGVFFAMVYPPTAGTDIGRVIYAAAKLWILLLPMVWMGRSIFSAGELKPTLRGLSVGIASGIAIAACIAATYALIGRQLIDVEQMREAATRNRLDHLAVFTAFGLYTSLINAWLEEYVWRWFVFRQCETIAGGRAAVFWSAALFTAHHVLALKMQTGWDVTLLASLGVFIGGCGWSWCVWRYRSIWPGYASHVLTDIAVFIIGWLILFGDPIVTG